MCVCKTWILVFMTALLFAQRVPADAEDALRFKTEYEALNGSVTQAGEQYLSVEIPAENQVIYLTAEGYKKLKDELDHMRSVERPAISAAIAEARDKGDLSENAEYDAAREAQGLLEMRIAKLEDTLANARVIDESKIDKSKVQILSKVTLLNHNNGKQVVYTIVAEHEANLREGKLAIGTPIAKALLGHKKGDTVDVVVPAGTIHFEILDISI